MQQQSQSSLWQPLIYLILIGFTFIAMPQTGSAYLLARCIQAIEVILCITLLIQRFRNSFEINNFSWRTNLWWLFYTCLAFTAIGMGLTPIFKWLNVILILLLGAAETADSKAGKCSDNAWFTGFAPYDDPEIVVTCFIEKGITGGYASYAVSETMDAYFASVRESDSAVG